MTVTPKQRPPTWSLVVFLLLITTAIAAVVLWILPLLLTRQVFDGMTAAERLKAENDIRPPLVAFLVAIGAAGTLWFTSRTYVLSREGHVTDRYTKAVGQLGESSPAVRIGGVYALERIGNDSPRDRTTIIYVLGAFIRECSKQVRARQDEPPEDVTAGLRVVGRLLVDSDAKLDLRGADLRNADLRGLPTGQVMLDGAKLQGADLPPNG